MSDESISPSSLERDGKGDSGKPSSIRSILVSREQSSRRDLASPTSHRRGASSGGGSSEGSSHRSPIFGSVQAVSPNRDGRVDFDTTHIKTMKPLHLESASPYEPGAPAIALTVRNRARSGSRKSELPEALELSVPGLKIDPNIDTRRFVEAEETAEKLLTESDKDVLHKVIAHQRDLSRTSSALSDELKSTGDDGDMRAKNATIAALKQHKCSIIFTIIGLLLIGASTFVFWVPGYGGSTVYFTVIATVGFICINPVFASVLCFIALLLVEYLQRTGTSRQVKWLSMFLYFWMSTYRQVVRVVYTALDAIVMAVLPAIAPIGQANTTDPIGILNTTYSIIARLFVVFFIWSLFRVLSRGMAIHLARHFNTRTYGEKLKASLKDERCIMFLSGYVPTPSFVSLCETFDSGEATPQTKSLAAQYVRDHHIDGCLTSSRRDLEICSILAKRAAILMFTRLFVQIYPNKGLDANSMQSSKSSVVDAPAEPCGIGGACISGIKKRRSPKITRIDFLRYFDHYPALFEEPEVLWDFLDPDAREYISCHRLSRRLNDCFVSRMNLATSIRDGQSVISSLDMVIQFVFNLLVLMLAVVILGFNFQSLWSIVASVILSFSFVFGGTLADSFNAVIFLFAVHPYDVGDKIQLMSVPNSNFVVHRIHLLTTELIAWDGKLVLMSNKRLQQSETIVNATLSEKAGSIFFYYVDAAAISEKLLEKYRQKLHAFFGEHKDKFTGEFTFTAREIQGSLKMKLGLWFEHHRNVSELGQIYQENSLVMTAILEWFLEDGITFSDPERQLNLQMDKVKQE